MHKFKKGDRITLVDDLELPSARRPLKKGDIYNVYTNTGVSVITLHPGGRTYSQARFELARPTNEERMEARRAELCINTQ